MLAQLNQEISDCNRCERLVRYREEIARTKKRSTLSENYWGKAVPGFGTQPANLLIVGLAPAAHGANRTGRIFTGDRSGDWLYEALHHFGFANQPQSTSKEDGLKLVDAYVTCVVHCAPPQNKPDRTELNACSEDFLKREILEEFKHAKVIVCLGAIAAESVLKIVNPELKPKAKFSHGKEILLPSGKKIIFSFHPSQQNTFTGKLTRPMFHSVFEAAREWIDLSKQNTHE